MDQDEQSLPLVGGLDQLNLPKQVGYQRPSPEHLRQSAVDEDLHELDVEDDPSSKT